MQIRKVRGQNKIHPIRMTRVEVDLVKKMGITLQQFIEEYLLMVAKQRRWKWYLERKVK